MHKATHHFDLINWWLDADPVEVTAYGSLTYYGKNGPFRQHHLPQLSASTQCDYFWDITKNDKKLRSSTPTANRPTATIATAASSRKTSTSSTR